LCQFLRTRSYERSRPLWTSGCPSFSRPWSLMRILSANRSMTGKAPGSDVGRSRPRRERYCSAAGASIFLPDGACVLRRQLLHSPLLGFTQRSCEFLDATSETRCFETYHILPMIAFAHIAYRHWHFSPVFPRAPCSCAALFQHRSAAPASPLVVSRGSSIELWPAGCVVIGRRKLKKEVLRKL
jgi:hypothetical protein